MRNTFISTLYLTGTCVRENTEGSPDKENAQAVSARAFDYLSQCFKVSQGVFEKLQRSKKFGRKFLWAVSCKITQIIIQLCTCHICWWKHAYNSKRCLGDWFRRYFLPLVLRCCLILVLKKDQLPAEKDAFQQSWLSFCRNFLTLLPHVKEAIFTHC